MNFFDVDFDPNVCQVKSSTNQMDNGWRMTGGFEFTSKILRNYGGSMLFDPVPLEFLSTAENKPQVEVKVGGLTTVCPTFDCSFGYIDVVSENRTQDSVVLTNVFNATTNILTIKG